MPLPRMQPCQLPSDLLRDTVHQVVQLDPKMACDRLYASEFLAEAIHEEGFDLLKFIVILYGVMKKEEKEG